MQIIFEYEGVEIYSIKIDKAKIKKMTFEMGKDSNIYRDLLVKIPTIKEIECYE